MASGRFSQSHGIVPIFVPLADNYNTITVAEESIDMALYNHATFIFLFSASCTAGAGVLTMSAGLTNGAADAAVTFTYRYSSAAVLTAGADVYGAAATATTITMAQASIVNRVLVVEVAADDMWIANVQYRYLTPAYDDGGTAGIFSCVAILSEPRYAEAVMPTAI